MAHPEFSLELGIPKEFPKRTLKQFRYHCHNSDGLNHCDCIGVRNNRSREECCFYGRPIEPLAFYLPSFSKIGQQSQCPLYGVLPKEVRDLVWEYALTDDGLPAPDCDNVFRRERGTGADIAKTDVACALLQTCKAVYLETYRLPMLLNGYLSYRNNGRSRPDLERIAPWQYALIRRLDLSLQQISVEGEDLEHALADWKSTLRHSGVYVAPRFYNPRRPEDRPEMVIQAHNFGLIVPSNDNTNQLEDGEKMTLPQEYYPTYTDDNDYPRPLPGSFTARAMVARSLTHLTLRMSRTDWWTWSDDPHITDSDKQLALDPACGMPTRPLTTCMLDLAEARRSGQHPVYNSTWGAVIGTLQDLKTLELILETFSVKQHQLETVVECAKTWKFPLQNTQHELTYDGRVESMKWAKATDKGDGYGSDSEPENQDMRLDEDDGFSSEETEDRNVQEEGLHGIQEATHDDQEHGSVSNPDGVLDESWDEYEPVEPGWYHSEEEGEDDFGGTSPVYNADDYADDWDAFPDELWMRDALEFDVKIVRFRRRRAE